MANRDERTFTLDELRRALHADFYGEGRDDPDDPDDHGEWEHEQAEAMFDRLTRSPDYLRAAHERADFFATGIPRDDDGE